MSCWELIEFYNIKLDSSGRADRQNGFEKEEKRVLKIIIKVVRPALMTLFSSLLVQTVSRQQFRLLVRTHSL